jgi:stage III sporulation protein AB
MTDVIKKYLSLNNDEFTKMLSKYYEMLKNQENIDLNTLKSTMKSDVLREEEAQTLYLLFNALGKSDLESQKKTIENFIAGINDNYKKACDEHKKNSSLYLKLGLLFGIAIALLLL